MRSWGWTPKNCTSEQNDRSELTHLLFLTIWCPPPCSVAERRPHKILASLIWKDLPASGTVRIFFLYRIFQSTVFCYSNPKQTKVMTKSDIVEQKGMQSLLLFLTTSTSEPNIAFCLLLDSTILTVMCATINENHTDTWLVNKHHILFRFPRFWPKALFLFQNSI
jgi:hypothetical protein